MAGPWSYDFELPALTTLEPTFSAPADFQATIVGVHGPWHYDFTLPAPAGPIEINAAFDAPAGFAATITPYQVIATDVAESVYTDETVVAGRPYRYRVTDALGDVVYSNDVTYSPTLAALFEAAADFAAALTVASDARNIDAEFAAIAEFNAGFARHVVLAAAFAGAAGFSASVPEVPEVYRAPIESAVSAATPESATLSSTTAPGGSVTCQR